MSVEFEDDEIRPSWQELGECLSAEPDIFFPEFEPSEILRQQDEMLAKSICSKCVVRQECLDYATEQSIPGGIWGGMNENERRKYAGKDIAGRLKALFKL